MFDIYGAAVDSRAGYLGPISIGLTVTLDVLFGGSFTGAAMNVARWLRSALASGTVNGAGCMVYILGPLLGGGLGRGWFRAASPSSRSIFKELLIQ